MFLINTGYYVNSCFEWESPQRSICAFVVRSKKKRGASAIGEAVEHSDELFNNCTKANQNPINANFTL